MNEFTILIKKMLNTYYRGGMKAVEEFIDNEPLSEETRREIKLSFAVIAKMEKKRNELSQAKSDGYTTQEWSAEELERISKQQ